MQVVTEFRNQDIIENLQNVHQDAAARRQGFVRTILIGLGGSGCQVLLRVRKRYYDRYSTPVYGPLAYVAIDTRREPESLLLSEFIKEKIKFTTEEYLFAGVDENSLNHYRERPQYFPEVREWFPHEFTLPAIDDGAGAIRRAGRLAFYHNFTDIRNRLELAKGRVLDPGLQAAFPNINQHMTQVIVVSSLAGGTGTGMFIDAGVLLQRLLPGFERMAYIVLPGLFPPADGDRHEVNTYAALKELELFQSCDPVGSYVNFSFPGEREAVQAARPLYRFAYLVSPTNEQGNVLPNEANHREALYERIAEHIFQDIHQDGSISADKRAVRYNINAQRLSNSFDHKFLDNDGRERFLQSFSTAYMSFGCTKLELPVERLLERCAHRRALDLVTWWAKDGANVSGFDRNAVVEVLKTDVPSLLAKNSRDLISRVEPAQDLLSWGTRLGPAARSRAGRRGQEAASALIQGDEANLEKRRFERAEHAKNSAIAACRLARQQLVTKTRIDIVTFLQRLADRVEAPSGPQACIDFLSGLDELITAQLAEEQKLIQERNNVTKRLRAQFEEACDQLAHAENWSGLHPLRKRSFGILVERAVIAGQDLLRARLNEIVEREMDEYFRDIRTILIGPGEEMPLMQVFKGLKTFLGSIGALLQRANQTVRENRGGQEVFVEVSPDILEDAYYLRVATDREADSCEFLAKLVSDNSGNGGGANKPSVMLLSSMTERSVPEAEVCTRLLDFSYAKTRECFGRLDTHVLKHTAENHVLWWPAQIPRLSTYSAAWIHRGGEVAGDAARRCVGGYMLIGYEPHQDPGVAEAFKNQLVNDLVMRGFTRNNTAFSSTGRKHSVVIIREVGGFPLLYMDKLADWRNAYHRQPRLEQFHINPKFANAKELQLVSDAEFAELTEVFECLLLGTIFGVVARKRQGDLPVFETRVRGIVNDQLRPLGNQWEATRALRQVPSGPDIRRDIRRRTNQRMDGLDRSGKMRLLKVLRHYLENVVTVKIQGNGQAQRPIEVDVLELNYEHIARSIEPDFDKLKEMLEDPPMISMFTSDPCGDGWLVMKEFVEADQ